MNKQDISSAALREKIGYSTIDALEGTYAKWKEKPTEGNRKRYLTWRLRLRLRFNDQPELLERLDAETEIGLFDEEVGPLYDKVEREIY